MGRTASEVQERIAPFVAAIERDGATLDEMTLTLSQALQPGLDIIGVQAELDALAADCPTPTREAIVRFLVGDAGFSGDRSDYHRWENSCLDRVLERRAGMPITLSVVVIEVARRLGVRLAGVGLPGHFLVGDPDDRQWFADPFHGQADLTRDDCRNLLVRLGVTRWSDRFLDPTHPRLVVARILNNLKVSCERRDDGVRLAIVMAARQAMPEFAEERGEAIESLALFN